MRFGVSGVEPRTSDTKIEVVNIANTKIISIENKYISTVTAEDGTPKIWIIAKDGNHVVNNSIDISVLSDILSNIRHIFDNIGDSKYGKDYKYNKHPLYLKDVMKGSVVLQLSPSFYAPKFTDDEIEPFVIISNTLERLLTTYNTHPDTFQSQLEVEIEDPIARLGMLKYIQKISNTGVAIELKTSNTKPESGILFPRSKDEYLTSLISQYKENGSQKIQGVLVTFSGDEGNYYFSIRTKNNKIVKCFYNPENEERIKSLYKKWISVVGDVKISQRSYKVENITEISEQTTEDILTIGNYELKKPIRFSTFYNNEDGLWCIVNDYLAIFGCGKSYWEAIQSLEGEIECHVIGYSEYPESRHSPDSLDLKRRLEEYLDIPLLYKKLQERYEE